MSTIPPEVSALFEAPHRASPTFSGSARTANAGDQSVRPENSPRTASTHWSKSGGFLQGQRQRM